MIDIICDNCKQAIAFEVNHNSIVVTPCICGVSKTEAYKEGFVNGFEIGWSKSFNDFYNKLKVYDNTYKGE